MSAHVVRPATAADISTVFELIKEMSDLQNVSEKPLISLDDLLRDGGFDPADPDAHAHFNCFVAQHLDGRIVGYAMSYFMTITMALRTLCVDSLHVCRTLSQSLRAGIERELADTLCSFGRENACIRVAIHMKPDSDMVAMWQHFGAVDISETFGIHFLRWPEHAIVSMINDTK